MKLPLLSRLPAMASLPVRQRVVAMVLAVAAVISGVVLVLTLAVDDATDPAAPSPVAVPTVLDDGDFLPAGVRGEQGRALDAAVAAVRLSRTFEPDDTDRNRREAVATMTDDLADSYTEEFDGIDVGRAEDGMESRGIIRGAGVVSSSADEVVCLVYADTEISGGGPGQRAAANAEARRTGRLLVTVLRRDGEWLVDAIDPA